MMTTHDPELVPETAPVAAGPETESPRKPYTPPRLTQIGDIADLLELLGPAMANYGTP